MNENDFLLTETLREIFKDFGYAINEEEDKIYFDTECILNIFSDYMETINSELRFDFENTILILTDILQPEIPSYYCLGNFKCRR